MSDVAAPGTSTCATDEVDGLLAQLPEIPTAPSVLVRIWTLVEDPATDVADLERVVGVEPPLAAKVLRLANSAYFGGRGRIRSLHDAITVLGFPTLRNLAVGSSVAGTVESAARHDALRARELWRHSVATGVLARCLAHDLALETPEELFTAGLLHDIGMAVISLRRPGAYDDVVGRIQSGGMTLVEAERAVLGYDHAMVGEAFARAWSFPGALQTLIRRHHDVDLARATPSLLVLALADGLGHAWLDASVVAPARLGGFSPSLGPALGIDPAWLDARRTRYLNEVAAADELVTLV